MAWSEIARSNQSTYSLKDDWKFANYLDTGNITENRISKIQFIDLAKEGLPSRARRKVRKNSIIYSTVRPNQKHFGIIKNIPENFLVSTGFSVLDIDESEANPDFVYYSLTQEKNTASLQAVAEQSTSAYPAIKPSDIENLPIKLPPLPEQRRIAIILGSLDDKIELNNAINRNLEEQAQAIFKNWFIDFAPFGGKMPGEWKEGKLFDLGTVVGGGTPPKAKKEYYTENGIAWITPKDLSLRSNKFTSKGEIDITQEGYDNSSAKLMPKGSVLFSSRAPIGYISIAQNEVCTNQGFKSVVPKQNIGTPYVYFYLKIHIDEIENKASGSTFKEASGALMNGLDAIIPSDEVLDTFNAQCNPIFEQQENLEKENQRLTTLRDALLPKLMSDKSAKAAAV